MKSQFEICLCYNGCSITQHILKKHNNSPKLWRIKFVLACILPKVMIWGCYIFLRLNSPALLIVWISSRINCILEYANLVTNGASWQKLESYYEKICGVQQSHFLGNICYNDGMRQLFLSTVITFDRLYIAWHCCMLVWFHMPLTSDYLQNMYISMSNSMQDALGTVPSVKWTWKCTYHCI